MKNFIVHTLIIVIVLLSWCGTTHADDGSRLWLRQSANGQSADVRVSDRKPSPTLQIAAHELRQYWQGGPVIMRRTRQRTVSSPDAYRIESRDGRFTLTSPSDVGLLYASYHLLRLQALSPTIAAADTVISSQPAYSLRLLNHWDNLDGTIERGYAGRSLWAWDSLPAVVSPRYEAYARANASIGINGTVLNNVNASPQILSADYLDKVRVLADIFRPYGIRVYLSVNFASPMALGGLETADPSDPRVGQWWKDKVRDIYTLIPDFGGFLVKANSEGQPGPCDYGRTHAEGANLLAEALRPYKGIVMWRAFVYSPSDADRAKQAYQEFAPLDGRFADNVIIQIKNGPVDFQPREPYSPLFGAMPQTAQMVELQVTQEYLGHANHIAYLAPMWQEFFADVPASSLRAIAGVANTGTDTNWCGHPVAQSNWYAYGRMAWDPSLTPETLAAEWLAQTFDLSHSPMPASVRTGLQRMLLMSREAVVNYMMPLGLHHLFAWGHHYGPEPWCDIEGARPDWMPSYYHRADTTGLGFDRTIATGSGATAQYPDSLQRLFDDVSLCPDRYLLWFHHAAWDHPMHSGRTLWHELCHCYASGVDSVRTMQRLWAAAAPWLDPTLHADVQYRLCTQVRDAVWWRDACLLYFQTFSRRPFPSAMEQPIHRLSDLQQVQLGISNFESPSPALLNSKR